MLLKISGKSLVVPKSSMNCNMKQLPSEHSTDPFESKTKVKCENDHMDDDLSIKQEEIHIKSEKFLVVLNPSLNCNIKQSSSDPFENETKVKCEDDSMDDGFRIKQDEIHIKSEDEEESSEIACCDLPEYRNLRNGILRSFKRDERPLQVVHKASLILDMLTTENTEKCQCGRYFFHIKRGSNLNKRKTLLLDLKEIGIFNHHECSFQSIYQKTLNYNILTRKSCEELTIFKCCQCSCETTHRNAEEMSVFKCDHCSYQSINKSDLNRHRVIHKSTVLKCLRCSYQTNRKDSLRRHAIAHKGAEELPLFKCGQCSYETIHKKYLTKHAIIHKSAEELIVFKCSQCSYLTVRKDRLKAHVIYTHKRDEELTMFKCDQCSFQTVYKGSLKRHAISHESAEGLLTNICSK